MKTVGSLHNYLNNLNLHFVDTNNVVKCTFILFSNYVYFGRKFLSLILVKFWSKKQHATYGISLNNPVLSSWVTKWHETK